MPAPLISASWRGPMMWVCRVAAGGFAALAIAVAHTSRGTRFDNWSLQRLADQVGGNGANALLALSLPAIAIGLMGIVVVFGALRRRWDVVALAVLGPSVAVLLAEAVFKPLVGRVIASETNAKSFPSGHVAAVASAALVLLIVSYQLPMSRRLRIGVAVVLAAWVVLAAAGLVRKHHHFATDTLGAILLCAAVVTAAALAIDAFAAAIDGRRARRRAPVVRQ